MGKGELKTWMEKERSQTKMRKVYILFFISFILVIVSFYLIYLLKQRTLSSLKFDANRIVEYKQWGYDTHEFEGIYAALVMEAESTSLILLPFRTTFLQKKHDNILRLTQAGYATEITKQKELVQSRLTYLRERVKNSSSLPDAKKQLYFNIFEITAGEIFEKNSDLNGIRKSLTNLQKQDEEITKNIEMYKKESLLSELQRYRTTCDELYLYFQEKKSEENIILAANCLNEGEKLLGPGYKENGAEFLASLSRERAFTAMQKALLAKQQLIQEEQYTQEMKRKEEARLTLVPPAPRQEGKLVVINLNLQRLYAYDNGNTLFASAVPITTGKYGFETVTGEFAVYLKEQQHKMVSPFPGIYYDDVVNYWMPFYLGYGLHDAPWRSVYGTQDYPVVGSHGCVNMPLNETIVLYNWAEVGTKVIVI